MDYLIAYLEGVLSFASPCLLPMLPIYLSYFSARQTRKAAMLRVAAFTAGNCGRLLQHGGAGRPDGPGC